MEKLTKRAKKQLAQDLILDHLSTIGYVSLYEDFVENFESSEEADAYIKAQMDRVAKMFGYDKAWFV